MISLWDFPGLHLPKVKVCL